jgi:hypothetical protein
MPACLAISSTVARANPFSANTFTAASKMGKRLVPFTGVTSFRLALMKKDTG